MLARRGDRTVEDRGRRLAADAVTMVRPVEVVELHEVTEAAIERGAAGEVVTPEHDAPVLGEDRLLQALDEAVGPSVTRPNPGVADSEGHAGGIELGFKLTAARVRSRPPLQAGTADSGAQAGVEKLSDGARRQLGQDSGHAVGARRIASGDLPHFADALELADVERVETEQVRRVSRLDVATMAVAQPPERPLRALRQQPRLRGAAVLEDQQPLPPGGETMATQQPLQRAGRHAQAPQPLSIGRQSRRSPRRFGDRDGQESALGRGRQLGRRTRPGFQAARVQTVHAIAAQPMLPAIKQRARDRCLTTRRTDADFGRATHDLQAHPLYALVEGHQSILPKWFPCRDFHSGKDRADGPRFLPTEVSTLTRPRTD